MGGRGVGEMKTGLSYRVAAQVLIRGGACDVCWWFWWDCACVRPSLRCRPPGLRRCGPHTSRPRIAVSRLATLSPTMTESPGASARLPSAPLYLCHSAHPVRPVFLSCRPLGSRCSLSISTTRPTAYISRHSSVTACFTQQARQAEAAEGRGSAFASFTLPFSQCFTAGSGVGVSA